MTRRRFFLTLLVGGLMALSAQAETIPKAVTADPPADVKFPARMEVIHVPSGGVLINGIVYVAKGAGPHPTLVLFHGLPGNEKNLDLAQAVRRDGWNAVAINYRGSWGSPGNFSFAQNLEDAKAVLAFLRDGDNARRLAVDPMRIAIGGHSMGGWVAAETAANDPGILGAVLISAADIGAIGQFAQQDRAGAIGFLNDNGLESLAGVTAASMADERAAHAADWSLPRLAPKLVGTRLYVLYSHDFVRAHSESLIKAIKDDGGKLVQSRLEPTDHGWSDHRIALAALVVTWLNGLH